MAMSGLKARPPKEKLPDRRRSEPRPLQNCKVREQEIGSWKIENRRVGEPESHALKCEGGAPGKGEKQKQIPRCARDDSVVRWGGGAAHPSVVRVSD